MKCDVRDWSQQVAVFEAAVRNSPDKSCDIVIANAGVVGVDNLLNFQGPPASSYSATRAYSLAMVRQRVPSRLTQCDLQRTQTGRQ